MKHFTQTTANGLCTPPCGSSQSKSTRFSLFTSLLLFFLLFVGSNAAWGAFTPGATYYVDFRTVDFYKDGAVLLVNFYNGNTYQGDGNRATVTETSVSHVYSFTIPSITTDNFKIVRLNPNDLSQRWNQTVKMYQNAAGANNCINLTSWPSGDVPCSWTTYVPSEEPDDNCSFTQGETIYFRLSGSVNWGDASAYPAAVFYYSNNSAKDTKTNGTQWDNMSGSCHIGCGNYTTLTPLGNNMWSVTVPRNDIGYIRIVRIAGNDCNYTWNNQSKMSVADAGTNNCIYCSGWDNTGAWETYDGGRTNTCGGEEPTTFQGGEVFYMKRITKDKNGSEQDFMQFGRCDFNLYDENGIFLDKHLDAEIIPNTNPVMLKFVVPAEYAGTVWGLVKVKQLGTGGDKETQKDAIPTDGKNYLIDGSTMEWGTYVPPTPYTGNLYLIGGSCTGQGWTLGNATLLDNDGNGIYTITRHINAVTDNSSDGFKFLETNANWDSQWRPTEENATVTIDGGKAQSITPDADNIVIKKNPCNTDTKWQLATSGTYTITIDLSDRDNGKMSIEAVPETPHSGDKFYVMGSHNSWCKNCDEHKMTVVDGEYAYKTYENITNNWDFKVAKEDGTELGWSYFSQSKSDYTCTEVPATISNIRPNSYSGAKNLTIYWDGSNVYVHVEDYIAPVTNYTVTIHPNGGTAVSPLSVGEGQTISSISSTYGNGTAKWYEDEDLTQEFILGTSTVTSDMDLYAKWGVSGNYYIGGDMWMHEKNGNNWAYYSTMAMTTTDGVASVTYIAPEGRNRFEILTTRSNWSTIANQGSELIAASTPTLSWAQYGPDNYNHFVFDLDAPKKVTIRYNGKVSVTAEDYDVVKTGWTVVSPTLFGHGSDDNAEYADNGTFMSGYNVTEGQMNENGERVFRNVNPGTYKFWIGKYNTNLDKTKQQIEVFGAANVDKATSSLSGYGSLADNNNAHINLNIPQDDKLHRRVTFTLTQKADIKIAFDGGKIKVNVLPTHTVTFKNGETTFTTAQVFDGNVATAPASNPEKAGYTFVKWQKEGADYNFSTPVMGDITLDAVWVEAYTVTFDLNGGGDAIEQTVAKNTAIAALDPEPTRDGYTFRGWTLNSSAYDFNTLVTQNITLVANWVENHTITFNSKGGSAVAALIVPADETGTAPSAPTRYGYSFNYWTLNDVEYNFTTLVTEDITLVAEWTDDPSVPGVGYDGTEYIFMHRNQMNFSDGINTTDATCWIEFATADESHRSATQYAAFACDDNTLASLAPAGKWQKVRVCRTGETTFNTTYGTSGWLNLDSKEKNYIKTNIGGWETYAFVDSRFFVATPQDINNPAGNWNWNGNGTLHTGSYTMTLAASTPYIFKLTRDYRKAKQEVHWSAQGNYTHYNTSLSNLSNTECTELSNNQIQIQLDRKAEVTISWPNYGDIIITKVPYYNVTFKNGETLISTVEVLSGNTVSAPANQIKEGYRFTGWDWNFEDPITEDKTINAQFIQQVTVSFIANGETYAPQQTIDINTIITAPDGTPAKEGYRFTGWDWNFSNPITEDKTITAQFVEQVTVTFMANGAMFAERTIDKGDKVTALEEPTAPAKAFDGWWTDAEGGTQIDIVNQIFNAHTTLYAHWVDDPTYLQQLVDATDEGGELTLTDDFTICDLVINKTLTINGNDHSIGNLTVEMAGDLTLSGALTVNDFSIYAKAGNSSIHAESGQVRNAAANLTANGNAYFYYTVEPGEHVQYGWYDFTVPFPVNTASGIKGIQDDVLKEGFAYGTDYAILAHYGDKHAQGEYPYKKFQGVMQPCRLYSITLDDNFNYKTLRFQKTNDGALVAGDNVTLHEYTGEVSKDNWNGVGNGTLHHANVGVSAEFIQVYQSGVNTFMTETASSTSLAIGTAFMIQEAGTMTLNQATHSPLLAPKREASVQPTAIQIASEGKPFSDQLFISADETAGQGYTQGVDVAKAGNIGNVNVPQIWTNAYDSKLCAHEAQLINGQAAYALSLYAPANGTYTLTSKNIPEGYTLYLTQNGNKIWDMSDAYVIDLTKGTTNEYGLLLVERYNAPTGIENGEWTNGEAQKVLRNGVLYIIRNGEVYDAQGARVK